MPSIDDDFQLDEDLSKDKHIVGLVDAMFSTTVGKHRKSVLTAEQAVAISVARVYASLNDMPELDELCDFLTDTSMSVKGRGMKDLVTVLTARMAAKDEDNERARMMSKSLGLH